MFPTAWDFSYPFCWPGRWVITGRSVIVHDKGDKYRIQPFLVVKRLGGQGGGDLGRAGRATRPDIKSIASAVTGAVPLRRQLLRLSRSKRA
jgi:hypothetical protein